MDELVQLGNVKVIPVGQSRLLELVTPYTASDRVGTASATRSPVTANRVVGVPSLDADADAVGDTELDRLYRVGEEMGLTP